MRSVCILAFLVGSLFSYGQAPVIIGQNQKFIHFEENRGLILIESLEPGMTLYRLSRKYNVSIEQIMAANTDLQPNAIPLGYPIQIPVNVKSITPEPPSNGVEPIWLSYRVQPKETLYRISKVYLQKTPEWIISLNPSAAHGLSIGQVLHIGWLNASKTDSSSQIIASHADSLTLAPKDFITEARTEGKKIHEAKGLAVWKPGNAVSQFYVLHPTAKVGSYMEITNPMLHRTITAKVAGNIPPGLYQSHVGIVVSPSTARALGVLDQQFFARWRYVE